jgi:hypothetical protein
MNLIISGFNGEIFFPLVSKILGHFSVRHCHLTYSRSKLAVAPKINATFHNVKDLDSGNYDVQWENITPLDETLIEKMNDCEVAVLRMMDRLPYELSYNERKELYLKHLRYWNHILSKHKFDLFLSSNVPHEVYDFIVYYLCKLKNVPTIFFFQTNITDTVTIMEDWESSVKTIRVKYQQLLKKYRNTDESKILLTGRFKKDFELGTNETLPKRFDVLIKKPSHNVFSNLISLLINLKFNRFLLLIKHPNLLTRSINTYIGRIILDRKIFGFYRNNTCAPNLLKKYIYLPLHMQPEVSTSPLAGAFVDQILIVQMIAYHLPKDVYIYVKENPYQTAVGRSMEFYKDLLKIPRVRFVPISFDTHVLTNNSLAVATATGSVGLEALYRCKPVLMFGHSFYQYAKGVFQIKNNGDCQRALKKILSGRYIPNIKNVKIFLKALEDTTIEGYIDVDYKAYSYVTQSISNKNILRRLVKEIELVSH